MSVGANSIKRAAKTANTAAEPKTAKADAVNEVLQKEVNPEEKPKTSRAKTSTKSSGKTEKKTQRKPVQKPVKKTEETLAVERLEDIKDSTSANGAKGSYEIYGIGQQLPVHLL